MSTKEQDFRKRLLSTFKVEAQDHLTTISSGLIELEKMPSTERQAVIVETIFRATHSMKGAARAVNMQDIEHICQSLEGIFSLWKRSGIPLTPRLFDTLYRATEIMRKLMGSLEEGDAPPERNKISELIKELSSIETGDQGVGFRGQGVGDTPSTLHPAPYTLTPVTETVRISTAKLSSLLLEAEEMLSSKMTANHLTENLKELIVTIQQMKKEWSKASHDTRAKGTVPVYGPGLMGRRIGTVPGFKGAEDTFQDIFDRTQSQIKSIEGQVAALTKSSMKFNRSLDRMVDNLLDDMKTAMMLPFSAILESFPLIVRDISREEGKEADLVIQGEGIEIDRRILEEMKDPLIHIVRNCVDHGIERPEFRKRNNKPRKGTVKIAISQLDGNKIEIAVSDDGIGIDIEKVKETAVKNGIISQMDADELEDRDALSLVLRSGFSTSPIITDISGRGIGLAIVREKVEKLSGILSVETGNTGTTFRILLPVTIATFRGILIRAAGQSVILPTLNVERVLRVRNEEIKTVENKETIELNGRAVSFVHLNSVLELPLKKERTVSSGFTTVLALSVGEKRIAFGVDEMLGEQEVLVKPLGKQLSRVRNVAGAAILGSGKPVPILNVQDLMKSAVKTAFVPQLQALKADEAERKTILVAEDSITSRILLKNILESAGYIVKTAVDGIEAITAIKSEGFDLVVSDVEMPRMNGFDLTARIRGDKKLEDLPVVLVTALETREDRERGIDVGANAYIVKSSFNQSNLLEVIRRLI